MLSDIIENLPSQIGVYIFWLNDEPIYIGKSVNIKVRVKSHVQQARLSRKEAAIVENATNITYLTTLSNFDALILEAKLIRKHKPRYNVLWKDDKHYLYIKITKGEKYPFIYPVRKEDDGKSLYFGPFKSTYMTEKLLYELRKIIPFCTSKKIMKRGCFYSRIGLCNPCPSYIESLTDVQKKKELRAKYLSNIRRIINILSGKTDFFSKALEQDLKSLSDAQRYEEAIVIRNKLLQFSIFLDKRSFSDEMLGVNVDIDQLQSEVNDFLKKEFNKDTNSSYRLECYDISNLFGEEPTASMVVFKDGEFAKKEFRKFGIHYKGISDIRMMREALSRRLQHDEWAYPDLILLDGGRPQLSMVYQYFRENNISIPLISIAKRPDRILTPQNNFKPISLSSYALLFKLFQSLRDESHRFAKKYHVFLRNRNLL
jgi:excinuclease ABC subunit C